MSHWTERVYARVAEQDQRGTIIVFARNLLRERYSAPARGWRYPSSGFLACGRPRSRRFAAGFTMPSRDMLARGATPPGATGKVFGFIYSGLDLGSAITPIILGLLLDRQMPHYVFVVSAAALALAIVTTFGIRGPACLSGTSRAQSFVPASRFAKRRISICKYTSKFAPRPPRCHNCAPNLGRNYQSNTEETPKCLTLEISLPMETWTNGKSEWSSHRQP